MWGGGGLKIYEKGKTNELQDANCHSGSRVSGVPCEGTGLSCSRDTPGGGGWVPPRITSLVGTNEVPSSLTCHPDGARLETWRGGCV